MDNNWNINSVNNTSHFKKKKLKFPENILNIKGLIYHHFMKIFFVFQPQKKQHKHTINDNTYDNTWIIIVVRCDIRFRVKTGPLNIGCRHFL